MRLVESTPEKDRILLHVSGVTERNEGNLVAASFDEEDRVGGDCSELGIDDTVRICEVWASMSSFAVAGSKQVEFKCPNLGKENCALTYEDPEELGVRLIVGAESNDIQV